MEGKEIGGFQEEFEFLGSLGVGATESLTSNSPIDSRGRRSRSSSSCSETTSRFSSSPTALGWPIRKADCSVSGDKKKSSTQASKISDMEMAKERFSKLLLGEDMSGSGKGVCSALAISNSITNLSATVFGQLWRLELLPSEKKSLWRREMEWLLCITDHIVELKPSWQTFPNGSKVEIMTCRPRSDLFINIPALRKLDNMLLEILDSFDDSEFWYIDQGIIATDGDGGPFCKPRQEDKWWLPVPRVPIDGLHENVRKRLNHKRDCTHQILKAAIDINNTTVADIEVPESYLDKLPKTGRACLGDAIYRYIISDEFSSECLLDCLDLSSEHMALEIANRVETAIHVWRKRIQSRSTANPNRSSAKSSWEIVKVLMVDGDKTELLAERAECLLRSLKLRFPNLSQTDLDTTKIQFNKDVGKSILESYSRVLESLAFNIVARIDDLLYVDDLTKHSEKARSVPSVMSIVTHKKSVVKKGGLTTPRRSPMAGGFFREERTPFLSGSKYHRRGFGVKKALTSYLGGESNKDPIPASNTTKVEQVMVKESSSSSYQIEETGR